MYPRTDDYTDMLNRYFSYWQDRSLSDGKASLMQYTDLKDKHWKKIYEGTYSLTHCVKNKLFLSDGMEVGLIGSLMNTIIVLMTVV